MAPANQSHELRIRRALTLIDKLQGELARKEEARWEPIAIVGMGCRFPGGCSTPELFWRFLERGGDGIREVPRDRWDSDELYDPNPEVPGTIYCRHGGFLDDIDRFDADFFGIAPREAQSIDPQHRMLLETAWEALEDAGIAGLSGTATGVFAGICLNDYGSFQLNSADRTRITPYDGPGNAFCFASGRLSYFLGAQGPSLSVDTACSSSLVALHLACLSLRNQECNVAIAGAVQLHLSPQTSVFLSRSKALAPDGRCKSFDASADGFGRGEGCGVVVLKRLSDALAAKDLIHAVVRGSAVNHDGRSSGLTVPNQIAQEQLIRQALASARVQAAAVDYVEAHGTGTVLGDPIEMAALSAVFGNRTKPLLTGSVKSNVGHLEAASGMAGLFKVVLSLKHGAIPRHLHFRTPNPHIPWSEIPVEIPVETREWRRADGPRIGGLSSFGFSGTNAHVVIEEAPMVETASRGDAEPRSVLVLSAKSEPALKELASRYVEHLNATSDGFGDICYSAATGRADFEHRLAITASSCSGAAATLRDFIAGGSTPGLSGEPPTHGRRVRLPHYPFQRRPYWIGKSEFAVPLLGKRVRSAGREIIFEAEFGTEHPAYFGEHRVHGKPMTPLAAFVELALEAGCEALGSEQLKLSNLTMHAAAVLPERGTRLFQTVLAPHSEGGFEFKISSMTPNEQWDVHVSGAIRIHDDVGTTTEVVAGDAVDLDSYYLDFSARGIEYGPSFRLIQTLRRRGFTASAEVAAASTTARRSLLHPVQLDACFQVLAAAFPSLAAGKTFLPAGIRRFRLHRRGNGVLRCSARATVTEGSELVGEIAVHDEYGSLIAEVEGFTSRATSSTAAQIDLYVPVWTPQPRRGVGLPHGQWLILADELGLGAKLKSLLERRGDHCVLAPRGTPPASLDVATTRVVHLWGLDPQAAISEVCQSVLSLVHSMGEQARLWIVTRAGQALGEDSFAPDPRQAPLWGLGRTIGNERPELQCRCIDLEPVADSGEVDLLLEELTAPDDEDQVAFRSGVRHSARLVRHPDPHLATGGLRRLTTLTGGTLENLRPASMARSRPSEGQVEIAVRMAALNFKDVLYALNMVPVTGEVPIGFECAGVVSEVGNGVGHVQAGDRVVAVLAPGSIADYVTADARFVARIPDGLSFAEAATIPIAFLTASLGLNELAGLRAGESVLIHAAAGGVGQAAVQLAQRAGANIFATASGGKWDFLRAQGISHVFDSRSISFADRILELTNGDGVDVILNSLKDEFVPAGLRALKRGGRFVEIGALGAWDAAAVRRSRPDVVYHRLQLGEIAEREPHRISSLLEQVLRDATPLAHEVFDFEHAPEAFRRMAQGSHTGKLLISIAGAVETTATYLITGGTGALGLQVAQWFASQGVSSLILAGRSGPSSRAEAAIEQMERGGTSVTVVRCDVSDPVAVAELLRTVSKEKPLLRGVVHAAGVLRDGVLALQDAQSMEAVFAPKIAGAWNLHEQTRHLRLDFFVCFSSFASLYGSPGQGAYAAANCYLDALMRYRRHQGLPGLSINWGSWAGEGMAGASQRRAAGNGVKPFSPERGLSTFGALLRCGDSQICAIDADWTLLGSRQTRIPSLLRTLVRPNTKGATPGGSLLTQLRSAPVTRRRPVLLEYLKSQLIAVLNLDATQPVNARKGFFDHGLDSLMTVEFRNRLQIDLGKSLPPTLLFDNPNLDALADYIALEVLSGISFSTAAIADEDVASLLARELESLEAERTHG